MKRLMAAYADLIIIETFYDSVEFLTHEQKHVGVEGNNSEKIKKRVPRGIFYYLKSR